ncbi:Fc.00g112360.m01.CDS01 [Cosmosporella sp. VM-42]
MDALAALFGLNLNTQNYSFFTVPAALLCLFIPHTIAVTLAGKTYDNANPRGLANRLAKTEAVDKVTKHCIMRAKAASENGFETLGFYAAGVAAANYANLENRSLNIMTFSYVLCRILYNVAYIYLGENRRLATVRSLVWGVGVGFAGALWVYAGLAVMNRK